MNPTKFTSIALAFLLTALAWTIGVWIHEFGHALVAALLGLRIDEIAISPLPTVGHVNSSWTSEAETGALAGLALQLSGLAAEFLVGAVVLLLGVLLRLRAISMLAELVLLCSALRTGGSLVAAPFFRLPNDFLYAAQALGLRVEPQGSILFVSVGAMLVLVATLPTLFLLRREAARARCSALVLGLAGLLGVGFLFSLSVVSVVSSQAGRTDLGLIVIALLLALVGGVGFVLALRASNKPLLSASLMFAVGLNVVLFAQQTSDLVPSSDSQRPAESWTPEQDAQADPTGWGARILRAQGLDEEQRFDESAPLWGELLEESPTQADLAARYLRATLSSQIPGKQSAEAGERVGAFFDSGFYGGQSQEMDVAYWLGMHAMARGETTKACKYFHSQLRLGWKEEFATVGSANPERHLEELGCP